jgi:hypothetical protein
VKKLKLVHYKITQCPEEFMRLPRTFVSSWYRRSRKVILVQFSLTSRQTFQIWHSSVRYVSIGYNKENIFFCKAVPGHKTGKCVLEFFPENTKGCDIDRKKCSAIFSLSAKAITRGKSGLILKLKPTFLLLYGRTIPYTDMLSLGRSRVIYKTCISTFKNSRHSQSF